jgi:competence protein ComEC
LFLLLSLVLVWGYVVLVGMPSSAVRAAVMLSVCTVFMLFRRRSVSLNTLSFAAILMLVVRPLNLFDIGFQLSFAAVFAIMIWMPLFDSLVTWSSSAWWSRPLRVLYGLLAVSLAAQLGTAPLVAYYFGRFSCYFMLTNLVAIPLAYLILLLMLLVLFALPVPSVQSVSCPPPLSLRHC